MTAPAAAISPDWEVPIRRLIFIAVLTIALTTAALAAAYPKAVPKRWHAPKTWLEQALCIHSREGAFDAATGNGYEGGFQFLKSTWESVGGPVDRNGHWASVVSPREQLYRAWLLWTRDGQSWREWGTAGRCGLR